MAVVPVNPYSHPSSLKITDLRVATLIGVPFRSTLIRIDTNQDIYGLGHWSQVKQTLNLSSSTFRANFECSHDILAGKNSNVPRLTQRKIGKRR